jgi:hypothetical protein
MPGPRQTPRNNKLMMLGVIAAVAAAVYVVVF